MTKDVVKVVNVSALVESENNPNVMEPERFDMLQKAIEKFGFLQPALVNDLGKGKFQIVDGHHRVRAAKALGIKRVPVVVRRFDTNNADALQVSMNRLRGELDLTRVGAAFVELQTAGWSVEDLAMTGFTPEEVDDLIKATQMDEDALEGMDLSPATQPAPDSLFVLEIPFGRREDMVAVRKALKRAAGPGGDLAMGALNLVGHDEFEQEGKEGETNGEIEAV